MSVDVLAAARNTAADANDSASLLALAQWLGRHYPDDPAARQLLADIAAKREQLRAPGTGTSGHHTHSGPDTPSSVSSPPV